MDRHFIQHLAHTEFTASDDILAFWNHSCDWAATRGYPELSAAEYADWYVENYPDGDMAHPAVYPTWAESAR